MPETNIETIEHLDGKLGEKFAKSLFCSAYPSFVALEFKRGGYTFSYDMGQSFEDVPMNLSENDVNEILKMISSQIANPAVNISLKNTKFDSEICKSRKELIVSLMEGCYLNIEAALTGDPEANPVIDSSGDVDGSQTIHFSNITSKEGVSDTHGLVSRLYNALIAENELDDLTFYIVEGYEPDFHRPNNQILHRYILATSTQLDYGFFEHNSADGGCLQQSVFEKLECLVIDPALRILCCIKPNSRNYSVLRLIAGPNIVAGGKSATCNGYK